MSESDKPPQPVDRCRLTVLDLLLLTFSYALGFGISRLMLGHHKPSLAPVELILAGLIFGGAVAAPVAVISQWALGRRRMRVSMGELLWIAPLINGVVAMTADKVFGSAILVQAALLFQASCSLCGAAMPILRAGGDWRGVECRWTDLLGSLTCATIGFLAACMLIYALANVNLPTPN
jgi:hypothetical protein